MKGKQCVVSTVGRFESVGWLRLWAREQRHEEPGQETADSHGRGHLHLYSDQDLEECSGESHDVGYPKMERQDHRQRDQSPQEGGWLNPLSPSRGGGHGQTETHADGDNRQRPQGPPPGGELECRAHHLFDRLLLDLSPPQTKHAHDHEGPRQQ